MKNNYVNKILPLTLKQLKQAEKEVKSRKTRVFANASYEVIECVARVVKISGMDLRITDETDFIDFVLFKDPLKDAVELEVGAYFRFQFLVKKCILKGSNTDGFAFEINNMKKVGGNQITAHLANCMCEKLGRQKFKQRLSLNLQMPSNSNNNSNINSNSKSHSNQKKQQYCHNFQEQKLDNKKSTQKQSSYSDNYKTSKSFILAAMQQQITKYCRSLRRQFDKQMIWRHFQGKFQFEEIDKVLQILSQKGQIMDLGLVFEWVKRSD